jgi:DNA-directed RNA polymerase specialized sigma24 family protein
LSIVLRELEALSYAQVSAVDGAPLGTVMSRLAAAKS